MYSTCFIELVRAMQEVIARIYDSLRLRKSDPLPVSTKKNAP